MIGHGIVYVSTLMVEKFSVRNHGRILKILAKAASDQMCVNPFDVLWRKYFHIKKIRISLYYGEQFLLLSANPSSLFFYISNNPLILYDR